MPNAHVRHLPPIAPPPPSSKANGPHAVAARSEPPRPASDPPPAGVASPAPRSGWFSPEIAITAQIADLERWALANISRDRQQTVRFWLLKGTAFIVAAGAAVAAALGQDRVAIGLSTLAALIIAVDAAWPVASFRNAHQRAVKDLRELENGVMLSWDKVRLAHPDPVSPARIGQALALLDQVQARREDIGKYLGASQVSPQVDRPA